MKKLACLVLATIICGCSPALAQPNFNRLADAIHKAENGSHHLGEAYGIHSVHYRNTADARRICLRTIKKQLKRNPSLKALAKHYCPKNWHVWLKNVSFFYEGGL